MLHHPPLHSGKCVRASVCTALRYALHRALPPSAGAGGMGPIEAGDIDDGCDGVDSEAELRARGGSEPPRVLLQRA